MMELVEAGSMEDYEGAQPQLLNDWYSFRSNPKLHLWSTLRVKLPLMVIRGFLLTSKLESEWLNLKNHREGQQVFPLL